MNNDTTPASDPAAYLDGDVNQRRLDDYTREVNIDKNTDELEELTRITNAKLDTIIANQATIIDKLESIDSNTASTSTRLGTANGYLHTIAENTTPAEG